MKVYQTNIHTGEYVGPIEADESPLEPGVFLIPAGAYEDKPPRKKKGHSIYREAGKWVHVKDVAPTPEEPQENRDTLSPEDSVRMDRDTLISSLEWRLNRYERQERAGTPTSDSEGWYLGALDYIQALRDIPSQKGFPLDVIWPEIKERSCG